MRVQDSRVDISSQEGLGSIDKYGHGMGSIHPCFVCEIPLEHLVQGQGRTKSLDVGVVPDQAHLLDVLGVVRSRNNCEQLHLGLIQSEGAEDISPPVQQEPSAVRYQDPSRGCMEKHVGISRRDIETRWGDGRRGGGWRGGSFQGISGVQGSSDADICLTSTHTHTPTEGYETLLDGHLVACTDRPAPL